MHHHFTHFINPATALLHNLFSSQSLLHYISQYGYVFIFLGTFFEGELVLLLGGFLAYLGVLNLLLVVLIGFVGAVFGDNIWYLIGRRGGLSFLKKYGKYFFINDQRIAAAGKYFERHGQKTVFFSRFIFGTRISSAVFAGALTMPRQKFVKANMAGAAIWAPIISLLGYIFGKSLVVLRLILRRTELALLILVVFVIILLILRFLFTSRENREKGLEP